MTTPRCQAHNPASCTSARCPNKRAFEQDFSAGINLRDKTHKQQKPSTPITVLTSKAVKALQHAAAKVTFISRGNDTAGAELTLADMADGDKARGNCWVASTAFMNHVAASTFTDHVLYRIEVEGKAGYHAATAVQMGGEYYVVDYTIRQFDPTLPFPYVGSQTAWVAAIERGAGANPLYDEIPQEDQDEGDNDGWEPVTAHSYIRLGG